MGEKMIKICPLCFGQDISKIHEGEGRHYLQCGACQLVFVPKEFHLTQEAEKTHYDSHENNPNDLGYRTFLSKIFIPLNELLKEKSSGLDFGSGPGPTLSIMFEEKGHTMVIYDKYYSPDNSVLDKSYDFITLTEVIEHLTTPARDLDLLWGLVKPNGYLGIMTQLNEETISFKDWYYRLDPTHICFFGPKTFVEVAKKWGAKMTIFHPNAIIFQKLL